MRNGKGWVWCAVLLVFLAPAAWAAPSGKVVVAQGVDAQLALRGAMVPPAYFKEKDKAHLARNPVGTGPFKFVKWVKSDRAGGE